MRSIVFAGLVLVLGVAATARDQKGYDLFQQALIKERAVGDLTAAIELYRRVADDTAVDRNLAARALMRMAGCYEQLGSPEARKIYERVARGFADQKEFAAEAARRLKQPVAGATPPLLPEGLITGTRPLPPLANVPAGVLSPNARFVAWTAGNELLVRDLSGTATRKLVPVASVGGVVSPPAWSDDSHTLAYGWCSAANGTCELRIIGTDGGRARTIATRLASAIAPLDWSSDGRRVFIRVDQGTDASLTQLAVVDVTNGAGKVLKSGPTAGGRWPLPAATHVSPDNKFVVYTPEDDAHGIVVMSLEDGREWPLLAAGGRDVFLGWTRSGRILYSSDRRGIFDLWLADFSDGVSRRLPTLIAEALGDIVPVRLSDEGTLFYTNYFPPGQAPGGGSDIYLAPLDVQTGRVQGNAMPASRPGVGLMTHPVWSPDSQQLAYKVGSAGTRGDIYIQVLASGVERRIASIGEVAQFDWSPDGQELLVASVRDGTRQISRIDLRKSETTTIVSVPLDAPASYSPGQGALSQPRWLPRGSSFLFVAGTEIIQRDFGGTSRRTVVTMTQPIQSLAVSPDGQSLAYISARTLMTVPLAGGEPRRLVAMQEDSSARRVCWSADGKYVIYADRTSAATVPETTQAYSELRRISASGGDSELMGLVAAGLFQPSMSPDGRYLAISVARDIRNGVHVLRNFLPGSAK